MKTIEQASKEYADKEAMDFPTGTMSNNEVSDWLNSSFKKGVDFAQKSYPIERYCNGYITNEQSLEIERNLPVILKKEDGYKGNEYFIACDIDEVFETDHGWTHWRPVNIK